MAWMSRKGAIATRVGLLFVLAICWSATTAAAEDAPYAEYRFLRRVGQIQITTGFLERTADLASRLASLERTGIVVLETNAGRTFSRTERVGVHRVVTTLAIAPPAGHGEGGASSNVDLRIAVDGKTRVDCPLWAASRGVDRITLEPGRGFITLNGHDGIVHFDGFEPRGIVDADWLSDRAEFIRKLILGDRLAAAPVHERTAEASLVESWRLWNVFDGRDEERPIVLSGGRLTLKPRWESSGRHWLGIRMVERIR
jgi:hypothetical protein